jgi:hypothetical protein
MTLTPSRLLMLGLILIPLWYFFPAFTGGAPVFPRQGQFVALMITGIVCLAFYSQNVWVRSFCLYSAVWILAVQPFSMIFPYDMNIANAINARDYARHLLVGLAVYTLVTKSDEDLDAWANIICIAAIVQCLIGLPQIFGWFPEFEALKALGFNVENQMNESATGLMENRNFFSGYLAISLPFFFRRNWFYAIPLLILHLALSQTSTAVIAAVGACVVYFGVRPKIILPIIVAGLIFVIWDGTIFLSDRWGFWMQMLQDYRMDWFVLLAGHGPYVGWAKLHHPHNEYMQILWEFGPLGVAMVLGYIATIYNKNRMLLASFAAICLDCFGSYPLHLPPSMILILIVLGLIERERNREVTT